MEVINQVDSKFILAKTGTLLLLFDQHAVDERIQLEALQDKVSSNEHELIACQVVDWNFEVSLIEKDLLVTYTEQLEHWGKSSTYSDNMMCRMALFTCSFSISYLSPPSSISLQYTF